MYVVVLEWRDGPIWPGNISTTQFLVSQGVNVEKINSGLNYIMSFAYKNVEFIKSTTAEAQNGLSWVTKIYLSSENDANLLTAYFNQNLINDAKTIGYNVLVKIEQINA